LQIWQGAADYTVTPANATELVEQWTNVWGADAAADETETISKATRTQFMAGSRLAVELYVVDGMGHAIAIGADEMGACPAMLGAFFADQSICSTLRAADFFGLLEGEEDDDDGSGSGSDSDVEDTSGCTANGNAGHAHVAHVALLRLSQANRTRGTLASTHRH